jgi:hypothetical protein
MSRGPATFKQTDLTRALKAARAAGVQVSRFEIDASGKIVVVAANDSVPDDDAELNEFRRSNGYG